MANRNNEINVAIVDIFWFPFIMLVEWLHPALVQHLTFVPWLQVDEQPFEI